MNTIILPDGYNGEVVECDCEPIFKDGECYKLRVHNSYLIKWCTRQQWENAMYEVYIQECQNSIANEMYDEYLKEEQQQKYEQWLKEENEKEF